MVDEQEEARQAEQQAKSSRFSVLLQWGRERWTKLALIAGLLYRVAKYIGGW